MFATNEKTEKLFERVAQTEATADIRVDLKKIDRKTVPFLRVRIAKEIPESVMEAVEEELDSSEERMFLSEGDVVAHEKFKIRMINGNKEANSILNLIEYIDLAGWRYVMQVADSTQNGFKRLKIMILALIKTDDVTSFTELRRKGNPTNAFRELWGKDEVMMSDSYEAYLEMDKQATQTVPLCLQKEFREVFRQ